MPKKKTVFGKKAKKDKRNCENRAADPFTIRVRWAAAEV